MVLDDSDDCLLSMVGISGMLQGSTASPAVTHAASVKSLELLQKISDDMLRRELNAASNNTAASKVVSWTSEGLQESASSTLKSVEAVSPPASSECPSSRNVTVLDGDPGSLWSANHLSEMSVDSEMLRVSESRSISSKDVDDSASAVDVSSVSHGENVAFPSVVETPTEGELRITQSDKISDDDKIVHEVEASEIKSTDNQSKPSYARQDEDVVAYQDNPADLASCAQITEDYAVLEETGSERREISVEASSDGDRAATQDADDAEDTESHIQTDVAEDMIDDLGMEARKTSVELWSGVLTADVEMAEDVADDSGKETTLVDVSDSTAFKESWPDMSSDSLEDLPASQAPADVIDELPLNELPSAVDEALPVAAKLTVIQNEEYLDSVLAEQDRELQDEWPPLPSDEELNLSAAEAEPYGDDYLLYYDAKDTEPLPGHDVSAGTESGTLTTVRVNEKMLSAAELQPSGDEYLEYCDAKDTELHVPLPQHDVSAGAESGTLTKVGASEKVLRQADHLRDIDSMHRFK